MRLPAGVLLAAALGASTLGAGPARAAWREAIHARAATVDPAALCEIAIHRAEARYDTPPALLRAISLVETGRPDHGFLRAWPWSVDVDGTPFTFATSDEAVDFTRTVLLAGARSVDIGCMQVNLESHPDAFRTIADGFDPATNVDYATRFLLALHSGPAHSVWATAIGYYHSETEALAQPYRARVLAIDDRLIPPGTPSLAAGTRVAPRAETAEQQMKLAWAATMAPAGADGSATP